MRTSLEVNAAIGVCGEGGGVLAGVPGGGHPHGGHRGAGAVGEGGVALAGAAAAAVARVPGGDMVNGTTTRND